MKITKTIKNDILAACTALLMAMLLLINNFAADSMEYESNAGRNHAASPEFCFLTDTISGWEILTNAIIQAESGGDPMAVGPTNDAGILQLTPIYVAEANRIANAGYTLEDRFDPRKSLEMFEIINAFYNPGYDIEKAIRLHNPGAGEWYRDRVMDKIQQETARYAPGNTHNGRIIVESMVAKDNSVVVKTVPEMRRMLLME